MFVFFHFYSNSNSIPGSIFPAYILDNINPSRNTVVGVSDSAYLEVEKRITFQAITVFKSFLQMVKNYY